MCVCVILERVKKRFVYVYKRASAPAAGNWERSDESRKESFAATLLPCLNFFPCACGTFTRQSTSKKDSYVPVHENGLISISTTGNHGTTPGALFTGSVSGWSRAHPLGDKANTENLYEVKLISKY